MKRFSLVTLTLSIALCLSAFFFRDQLLTSGTKVFLKSTFHNSLTYRDISSKDGRISIEGLQLSEKRYQITLDSVDFSLEFKKMLTHPKQWLSFLRTPKQSWIGALVVMKQYGLHLNLDNGVLQLDDQRYFFSFQNGERSHEIGKLSVSHDPRLIDHPFLEVHFNMRGNQLTTQLRVEEVPSERFLHLAAFTFPETMGGFEGAQGHIELSASVIFEEDGKIDELSTRFACEKFEVHYPELEVGIQMDSLRGDLNYPEGAFDAGLPVWKKMLCDLTLKNGGVIYGNKFALTALDGSLALDPRVDPSLSMKGELVGHEKPLALQLEGRGAIHEDHAYWLEFDLNLNDYAGTACDAFMSICRPEQDAHVVQLEANHLLPEQVEMLKGYFSRSMPRLKEWTIEEGSFGGKLVALFEKGNLAHFEIQDLVGENVALTKGEETALFSRFEGEGRLFEEFSFEVDLTTAHFFGLFSNTFKEAFSSFREDDPAHLSTQVRFRGDEVETLGSVEFLPFHESLQFGFKSQKPFPSGLKEVNEGWARSEKLSEHLYAPFVTYFSEDLDIKGDVDLVATYNGEEIDLGMQVDQFHAKHPLMELMSDSIGEKGRTEGRAKLTFNLEKKSVEGSLPLSGASGYDCTYGIVGRELDGEFSFRDGDLWGEVKEGTLSYDGKPLLTHSRFKLSMGHHFLLQDLKGILPLKTDKDFELSIAQLDEGTLNMALFDGKEPLFQFDGKKAEAWEGELSCAGINGRMAVSGDWDIFQDQAHLDIVGQNLHLKVLKQGQEILFKELKVGETTWKGLVVPADEGFTLAHIEMENEKASLRGEGLLFVDLPSSEQSFGLRSDILVQGEIHKPFEAPIRGKEAAKLAYSPTLGLVITGLDLETEGGELQLTHFEYSLDSGKSVLHNGAFSLTEPLLDKCIGANLLPAMIRNFRFAKDLSGTTNISSQSGKTQIEAIFEEGATWKTEGDKNLYVTASLDGDQCQLKLREAEDDGISFSMKLGDGFDIHSVKGSLGRLSADLKQAKNHELKGSVKLDFTLFDQLFDIPLTRYVNLWQAGGGYTFDGAFTQSQELKDWGFKGKVLGQGFECAGYQLRSLEARVEVLPGQVMIENLDVTDDAGKLWIGEGALMKAGPNWIFSFPLVEVRSFQPSFLHKLAGKEKRITPFIIKSGSIENVRGRLDDPNSMTGEGRFRFTNVSKKGEMVYPRNLPISVIEQMGLDGAMFVPASGDVDIILQNGRCYIRTLNHMASLQNRSEFQPPKNGVIGYLDYSGNIFLDLQVKQREVRSLSNLTFRVRGTLDEPEITVR